MKDFVHLHLHSEYSLLDGACRISEIPAIAKEMGHSAVAITDHGVMYGVIAFYKACVEAGVKPIIGCEVYVAPRTRFDKTHEKDAASNHLVLLAKNETGYKNLLCLVSKAYTEGFYSKPRVDVELLGEYSEGLIALSGCLAGYIPRCITSGSYAEAERYAVMFRDMFGAENFYLEIQDHGIPEQKTVIDGLVEISKKHGIGLAATNDVHYLRKKDAETQAIMMCIQTNNIITDGRPIGFDTDEFYYKSTDEMTALFGAYEGAIENTGKIADMCDLRFDFSKLYLPRFTPENGMNPVDFLRSLAEEGFESRLTRGHVVFDETHQKNMYTDRMNYELDVIQKMGYSEYFLIVWDFVVYAKSQGIPVGPGRGSGAGSIIAYFLGITDVDPLQFDLLFERFLNPERISMPDFDIDFCYDRRDEAIEYVRDKYGRDHTAQIITFGTMAARAAVRDVGRALGMSVSYVDILAKKIPQGPGVTLKKAFEESEELKSMYDSDEGIKKLIDTATALEGMPRHSSTHAAGVVITDKPLHNYVPLALNNNTVVTQYNMDTVADLGLLKFDFLALRYLTVCSNAEKQVRETIPDFDLSKISLKDKATFDLLTSGHTAGLFQLESMGMRQMLTNMKPDSMHDITAAIALYRPGPMASIPSFIEGRNDSSKIKYKIPELAPILDITYGCMIYQEQVMQILREIAGYTFGQADIVRRAMSKKKGSVIQAEREHFIRGAVERGHAAVDAEEIFNKMADFANYAFNKSHAAAYAVITYRTAYLKANHPKQYLAALLTSVLGIPAKVAEYRAECLRYSIGVLPPDINESDMDFHVYGNNIRFGLLALKNVGRAFVQNIIAERKISKFKTFEDFLNRAGSHDMNKRQVEALIKAGAFDGLNGIKRSQLLATYEKLMELNASRSRKNLDGQIDMFGNMQGDEAEFAGLSIDFQYPDIPEYTTNEKLALEREISGLYLSGHVLDNYADHLAALKPERISDIMSINSEIFDEEAVLNGQSDDIPEYTDRQRVTIAGIVTHRTNKMTKNGDPMAFIVVEDRTAEIEVIVFPRNLTEVGHLLNVDRIVVINGNITVKEDEEPKIILQSAALVTENDKYRPSSTSQAPRPSSAPKMQPQTVKRAATEETSIEPVSADKKIYVKIDRQGSSLFDRTVALVEIFSGPTPVILYDSESKKYIKAQQLSASANDFVIRELRELLGYDNVVVK